MLKMDGHVSKADKLQRVENVMQEARLFIQMHFIPTMFCPCYISANTYHFQNQFQNHLRIYFTCVINTSLKGL